MDFSNGCIAWFQSYLSKRILFVSIENNSLSGVKQGSILGLLLFLIYVHDMLQAVNSNLFLHAGDPRLMFQHIDVEEIATVLNNDFENIVQDCFLDKTLNIHFGEDKTKSILFVSQRKIKNIKRFNTKYKEIEMKQYSQVTYLGCDLSQPNQLTGFYMVGWGTLVAIGFYRYNAKYLQFDWLKQRAYF